MVIDEIFTRISNFQDGPEVTCIS